MKRLSLFIALTVLAISISGCGKTAPVATTPDDTKAPVVTTSAVTPAMVLTAIGSVGTYTEEDSASTLAKMKTGASVSKLTRYSLKATTNTVDVTVGELKDVAQAAAVKAEIESQLTMMKSFLPDQLYSFVDVGNPSMIITVSWDKADAGVADKATAALSALKK